MAPHPMLPIRRLIGVVVAANVFVLSKQSAIAFQIWPRSIIPCDIRSHHRRTVLFSGDVVPDSEEESPSIVLEFDIEEEINDNLDSVVCSIDEGGDNAPTKQEEILRSLGFVEPECPEDRDARIAAREAASRAILVERKRNLFLAWAAFLAAVGSYVTQVLNPVTPVQLLAEMQSESAPIVSVGRTCRPAVIDFWAPWCVNCREAAPALRAVERKYAGSVDFVMVNADDSGAWPLIDRFGVDAIPHMALVGPEGNVRTALIGPVPTAVLEADLDVLLKDGVKMCGVQGKRTTQPQQGGEDQGTAAVAGVWEESELPYTMYDAFRARPEERRISFDSP